MKLILRYSSTLTILIGLLLLLCGTGGVAFTYSNVARENVTTTSDSAIPNTPVRGVFTLKTQTDIIREHTLRSTGGKTFAEMPRTIPEVDADGNQVLDKDGKPVMVPNVARNAWFNATTLITALNLAIISYAFSGLVMGIGIIMIWFGIMLRALTKIYKKEKGSNNI